MTRQLGEALWKEREFSGKPIRHVKASLMDRVGGVMSATTKGLNYDFTSCDWVYRSLTATAE